MLVPFNAKALFAYHAQDDCDLSVDEGELIVIEEVNESGWCLARKGEEQGWVPTEYVQKVEDGSDPSSEPITVGKPQNSRAIEATESHSNASADQQVADALKTLSVASSSASPSSSSSTSASAAGSGSSSKICASCLEPIKSAFVMAKDRPFHPQHFQCDTCKKELGGRAYLEKDSKFYCEDDYYAQFNPKCGSCNEVIKGPYISALDQSWHAEHFVCAHCNKPFEGNQFRKHGGKPYCEKDFADLFAPKCAQCNQAINGQVFEALDKKYHLDCFVCAADNKSLGEGATFHVHEGKIYCPQHFEALFLQKCSGCQEVIKGQFLKVLDHYFHPQCWKCSVCDVGLKAETCTIENGKFMCKPCAIQQRQKAKNAPAATAPPAQAAAPAARKPVLQQMGSNPQAVPADATPESRASAALAAIENRQAASAAAAPTAEPSSSAASPSGPPASGYATPDGEHTYPYEVLKDRSRRPACVDPTMKEQYLCDDEFQALFKMDREAFNKLVEWKKKALKTPLLLF